MTDTDTTVVPFGRPVTDLRSAVEEALTLEAILEVATARKAAVRAYLEHHDDAVRRAMHNGDGYAHEVPGLGTVTVTSPNRKPKVVDRAAFESWALRTYPDRTSTREVVDWTVVEDAARDDAALRARLFEILDEIDGAVTVETLLDERLERDLIKPKTSTVLDDGETSRVVIKDTGEVVAGLEAPYASKPSLRLTVDPDARARVVESIVGRLPEIDTGDEA